MSEADASFPAIVAAPVPCQLREMCKSKDGQRKMMWCDWCRHHEWFAIGETPPCFAKQAITPRPAGWGEGGKDE